MDWYGNHVQRILGNRVATTVAGAGIRLQPVVELVSDPLEDIQSAADLLKETEETGKPRPHSWMRRRTRGNRVRVRPSGVTTWEGRVCCFEHLRRFEGRPDLVLPFETSCPACRAVYRIRLGAVRG